MGMDKKFHATLYWGCNRLSFLILKLTHVTKTGSRRPHPRPWSSSLQWRHNGFDSISNHQRHHCLLSPLFGCRSKKTSKLRVTVICAGNSPGASNVEMFPFDDVIMSMADMVAYPLPHPPCTALMIGICLPLGLCKGLPLTLKKYFPQFIETYLLQF